MDAHNKEQVEFNQAFFWGGVNLFVRLYLVIRSVCLWKEYECKKLV